MDTKRPPRTVEQRAAAAAARKARRMFAGTNDVGLLLALVALQHRERTGDELASLADRPAAAVAASLRVAGLELPERVDHGHDARRRIIYAMTSHDARAVAAWTHRRDRSTYQPDPTAQDVLFDADDGAAGAPELPEAIAAPAKPVGSDNHIRLIWIATPRRDWWRDPLQVPDDDDACPRLAA